MTGSRLTVYDSIGTGHIFKTYFDMTLVEERNKIHTLDVDLLGIDAADYTILAYNSLLTFEEYQPATLTYVELFRGYIRQTKKISYGGMRVSAQSPGILFYDRSWSNRTDAEFINQPHSTVVSAVASGIMSTGTNAITDKITIQFDLNNKLQSIAQLANIMGGEWWTDTGIVLEDRINVALSRYTAASVATFQVGQSSKIADDNVDDRIYNCISVLGQGDGINQITAFSYGFTNTYTDLDDVGGTKYLNSNSTEFYVTDAAGMASANGIVYIGSEKIKYASRTGSRCYTLTTWNGTAWVARSFENGSYAHTKGSRVWYAGTTTTEFTKTAPQTGSSVQIYGIKEYPHYDKSIARTIGGNVIGDWSSAGLPKDIDPMDYAAKVAKIVFDRYKTPLRTLTITKSSNKVGTLQIGQTITVIDTKQNLNSSFKVYKIQYKKTKGRISVQITCNSLLYTSFTQMDEIKKNMDTSGIYGQGATNIYQINAAENVDLTHPMNLRFYLPEEAVAVNSIKLNFKMKNYRADSTATSAESAHTHTIAGTATLSGGGSTSGMGASLQGANSGTAQFSASVGSSWVTIASTAIGAAYGEGGCFVYASIDTSPLTVAAAVDLRVQCGTGRYYPGSSGTIFNMHKDPSAIGIMDFAAWVGEYVGGKTLLLQAKQDSGTTQTMTGGWCWNSIEDHSHSTPNHTHPIAAQATSAGSAHTHAIGYGIYENTIEFTPPGTVTVAIGLDGGSMTTVGTYSANQTAIELSDIINFEKSNWYNIRITPAAGAYNGRMRIEANVFQQIYIESK